MDRAHPSRDGLALERRLLDAARAGDPRAFELLVAPLRSELRARCRRMLGSADAEDALQDGLLRAWRGLSGFEGRSSVRAWLHRIVTNACIELIARRARSAAPSPHPAATGGDAAHAAQLAQAMWVEAPHEREPAVVDDRAAPEARYERREAVELAFLAAVEHLPARQRAALILREALGFSAAEVATALGTTTAAVNSALQRARVAVEGRVPERGGQAALGSVTDERIRAAVAEFVEAWERGDVETVAAVLTEAAR